MKKLIYMLLVIPNPGYPTYASVTTLVGATPVFYDLSEANGWFPDLFKLSKKDLSNVKLMWVNYPHMPTGATVCLILKKVYSLVS